MNSEIKKVFDLQKFETIESLTDAYVHLQQRAVQQITQVLDTDDSELLNNLINLSTSYNKVQYIDGIKITSEKDRRDEPSLIEINHCQFNLIRKIVTPFSFKKEIHTSFGLVTLFLNLNISNYLKRSNDFVYIVFWRSDGSDYGDSGYVKNLVDGADEIKELGEQSKIFYRYLPHLYLLGTSDAHQILSSVLSRPRGSFSECEILDPVTGKTIEWV